MSAWITWLLAHVSASRPDAFQTSALGPAPTTPGFGRWKHFVRHLVRHFVRSCRSPVRTLSAGVSGGGNGQTGRGGGEAVSYVYPLSRTRKFPYNSCQQRPKGASLIDAMSVGVPKVWLLVEDDDNDFILLKRALSRADPTVQLHWVRDGAEAKEYLNGSGRYEDRTAFPLPTMVLSDLKMPRCSGLELVQWVRQQPRLRALPFIMFSASDQPADV